MAAKSKNRHHCITENEASLTEKIFRRVPYGVTTGFALVIQGLKNDVWGKVIRGDEMLLSLGREWFMENQNDIKELPTLRRCRTFLRHIAKVRYGVSKDHKFPLQDIMQVTYVNDVIAAIDKLSRGRNAKTNSSAIHYAGHVKLATGLCKGLLIEKLQRDKAADVSDFLERFNAKIKGLLRNTNNSIRKKRNEENRAAVNQVDEENTKKSFKVLRSIMDEADVSTLAAFRKLQNAFVTFLTLSNGRRGNEVAALTMKQAELGLNSQWRPRNLSKLTTEEQMNLENYTYIFLDSKVRATEVDLVLHKKYNHILELLMNKELRSKYGVREDNPYVFASVTQNGFFHSWN